MIIKLEDSDIEKLAAEVTRRVIENLKLAAAGPSVAVPDKVLDVEALAEYLGVSVKWIYNHVHELPHFKRGGVLRFKKTEIDGCFKSDKVRLKP